MMEDSKRSMSNISWNTKYSADSVEFCPLEPCRDVFAVGTYQLDQSAIAEDSSHGREETEKTNIEANSASTEKISDRKRLGSLYLHQYKNGLVETLQVVEMAGILDMKWSCQRVRELVVLGIATSDGQLLLYSLQKQEKENFKLTLYSEGTIKGALALSLDWSNRKDKSDSPHIAVSDSKGFINIFEFTNDNKLDLIHRQHSHGFEAWIVAFNYWSPTNIYSGGDDAKLKCYDLRCGLDQPVNTLSKIHSAGITSLHSNDVTEFQLLSGSYDETVCLWDTRAMKRPVKDCNVGGGVWRLKWMPFTSKKIAAACMYNNFHVLSGETLEVESSYEEHKSIAYGLDWSWADTNLLAAASFYNFHSET